LCYLVEGLKASKLVAVTGNHGRLTSDRKKDHSGEAELIVYNYLKDRLTDVEVKFSEFWITDLVEGIGHVLTHGHHRLQKGENIVRLWQNTGQLADYILYKQGHTHNRNIIEDTNLYRHYVVPALFTGSKYNERNGYGNKAGFSISYKHPFTGQVKTEDYTL
jgi:predicted phosphodiesterase